MLLDRVFPLVRLTGQLAYVSRTKAFPTPCPCLPYEWLNPIIWYLIWNFFFPKVSILAIFFQYNLVYLSPNFWWCGKPFQDVTFPESGSQKKIPNAIVNNLYLYRTIYFVEINIDQNLASNFSWSKIGYQEEPMTVVIRITSKTSFNNDQPP